MNSTHSAQFIPLLVMKSKFYILGFKTTHERRRCGLQIGIVCLRPCRNVTTYKPVIPLKFKSIIRSTKPFKGIEIRHHLIDLISACIMGPLRSYQTHTYLVVNMNLVSITITVLLHRMETGSLCGILLYRYSDNEIF